MKRGDLVIVSPQGHYGKPRPAIVIQSDWLAKTDSVLVALLTSEMADAPIYRLHIEPSAANGLKTASQVMVDKILALPRDKCSAPIGRMDESSLIALNHISQSYVVGCDWDCRLKLGGCAPPRAALGNGGLPVAQRSDLAWDGSINAAVGLIHKTRLAGDFT